MSFTMTLTPISRLEYPKFLENEKLPLMQTAITELVQQRLFFPQMPAKLISEYACAADQVETQAMIQFFEGEIPSMAMMNVRADHNELGCAFDELPYEKQEIVRGSTPLQNTAERRLVALASAYFGYKKYAYKLGLENSKRMFMAPHTQEYYDFLGRISGITIISRCVFGKPSKESHTVIFGSQVWCNQIDPNKTLYGEPQKVVRFLSRKGYSKSGNPACGQIVVYHTRTAVNHFGKIVEIDNVGQIMVLSKFGLSHYYRHRIELAQFHYGNSVTFLNPPN